MQTDGISRRAALACGGIAAATLATRPLPAPAASPETTPPRPDRPFRFCLNTATVRGHKLGIVKEVELAAQAGYDALEPWIDSLQQFVQGGGKLAELGQRIRDAGLTVESAIGFPEWIVDDDERRARGMERAKQEMDMVAQIGGRRFAAPPAGATGLPKLDLRNAVDRYRALLELGKQLGVVAQLELWGFSQNLNHLGECVGVAVDTGHPDACVLADVFHLFKGGSDYRGIQLLAGRTVQVLHMNDYAGNLTREKIDDSFRDYPGEGVAPLVEILQLLHGTGGTKVLSLELFNRLYWTQPALDVAKSGLGKMKAVVAKAGLAAAG